MTATYFQQKFHNKTVALLGFGREGKSSYRILRQYLPALQIVISDSNANCPAEFEASFGTPENVSFCCGENSLACLDKVDVIVKSPGVSLKILEDESLLGRITSQTEIFLTLYRKQVIGITGTKGKSTTSSLLYAILKKAGRKVLLGGNIGIPPLELLEQMTPETLAVFEMSSHQLENLRISPSMSILLNVFQEHLDHYTSYRHYQLAKYNIARWQEPGDFFIYNMMNPVLNALVEEFPAAGTKAAVNGISSDDFGAVCSDGDLVISLRGNPIKMPGLCLKSKLPGQHNLTNTLAAVVAAWLQGVEIKDIESAVETFSGLPHRLEFVGERQGAFYYNDSISTIPESTIEALKTFPQVHTLLLGGFDRGVDYGVLTAYLASHQIPVILFIGKAGQRMKQELEILLPAVGQLLYFSDFESAMHQAFALTPAGNICLLSPAAASYDMFRNFEQRGEKFRQMVLGTSLPPA